MEEAESGTELAPIGTVELNEGRAIIRAITKRLESLEGRMTRSESVVEQLCQVQHQQLAAFKDLTRNLGKITESLASLDVNELKRDVVGAVRDMMRETSISQVCAQHPGPPARDPPPTAHASEKRREESGHPQGQVQVLSGR